MSATRQQDEILVDALALLCRGISLAETARIVGKGRPNLRTALRKVLLEDLAHDDRDSVLPAYPRSIIESVTA